VDRLIKENLLLIKLLGIDIGQVERIIGAAQTNVGVSTFHQFKVQFSLLLELIIGCPFHPLANKGLIVIVPERYSPFLGSDTDNLFGKFECFFALDFKIEDLACLELNRVLNKESCQDFVTFVFHSPVLSVWQFAGKDTTFPVSPQPVWPASSHGLVCTMNLRAIKLPIM